MDLKRGANYLVRTKSGAIYFGVFFGCCSAKFAKQKFTRTANIFKDVWTPAEIFYNELFLQARHIEHVLEVDFDKAKFLNMPESKLDAMLDASVI